MQKKIKNCLFLWFFLILTFAILLFPKDAFLCAQGGLKLWFETMIPTLFPFMVLSGIFLRLNLSRPFARLFRPLLAPLFQMDDACLYVILIGFLCGFPMGAKVCGDMYRLGELSKEEAEYLSGFCNHIGPVFFTGIVLPLLPKYLSVSACLFGMYGIPLCYGLFLRHTKYKGLFGKPVYHPRRTIELRACSLSTKNPPAFSTALEQSVSSALESITKLGGYMIFFNLLLLFPRIFLTYMPHMFTGKLFAITALLLEITSGVSLAGEKYGYLLLPFLHFGGISCIAQTMSMFSHTDLSLKQYVGHKCIQALLCMIYMAVLFLSQTGH